MNTDSPNHWIDTNKLIDYCFSNFKALNIAENEADVAKSEEENLGVLNSNKMYAEMSGCIHYNADNSRIQRCKERSNGQDR